MNSHPMTLPCDSTRSFPTVMEEHRDNANALPSQGVHYILDVFGYDLGGCESTEHWQRTLSSIFDDSPLLVLHEHFHSFTPQGITGYLLLSTSHLSIHTWPEHGYIAIDLFSCLSEDVTKPILDAVLAAIPHESHNLQMFRRGYQLPELVADFLNPIFAIGQAQRIKISRMLYQKQTDYQKVEVFDTPEFGRCLAMDGVVQAAEKDHLLYDAVFTSALIETQHRVLILGGGDGFVAQAALAKYSHLEITVVEIDVEVVSIARNFFGQTVFENERVELVIGDAGDYLRECKQPHFDAIFFDLTDTPLCGDQNAKTFSSFYAEAFRNTAALLAPNGRLVVQAGASQVTSEYINSAKILTEIMKVEFHQIREMRAFIPSFGEECSFLLT